MNDKDAIQRCTQLHREYECSRGAMPDVAASKKRASIRKMLATKLRRKNDKRNALTKRLEEERENISHFVITRTEHGFLRRDLKWWRLDRWDWFTADLKVAMDADIRRVGRTRDWHYREFERGPWAPNRLGFTGYLGRDKR